eukprot:1054694_1
MKPYHFVYYKQHNPCTHFSISGWLAMAPPLRLTLPQSFAFCTAYRYTSPAFPSFNRGICAFRSLKSSSRRIIQLTLNDTVSPPPNWDPVLKLICDKELPIF